MEALHARLGPDRRRAPATSPRHALERDAGLARRDRGLAGARSSTIPSARTGTRRRSSTSCTSSSTAARSGRPARSAARSRTRRRRPVRAARVPRLPVLRHASTSTSTRRSRSSSSSRSSSARGIRDLLAAIAVDDPEIVDDRGVRASRRRARSAARCRMTSAARTTTRSTGPNRYQFQDVNDWKDLGPKFVLQVWRDAVAAGRRRRRPDPRGAGRPSSALLTGSPRRDRDGDGLPEHDGLPDQTYDTWPMHGPSAYGGSLWLAALAAAEAMAGRLGDAERRAALGGLVRARPGRLRPPALARRPLRLRRRRRRRARTASWPTSWPASGTPTRPASATCSRADRVEAALRTIHRDERVRLRRRADGRGQRHAPGRHGRPLERAVGRGLGRHDLRARGVHDRPRA